MDAGPSSFLFSVRLRQPPSGFLLPSFIPYDVITQVWAAGLLLPLAPWPRPHRPGLTQPSGMHHLVPVFAVFCSSYALVIGSVLLSCAQRY